MMRIFSFLLITTLVYLPQLSGAAEILLDNKACGSQQNLTVGDKLGIQLPGNPTTGFLWTTVAVPSLLQQQGEFVYRADSLLVGAGGITSFSFSVTEAGDGALELAYRRPWEKGKSAQATCRIRLIVQESCGQSTDAGVTTVKTVHQ